MKIWKLEAIEDTSPWEPWYDMTDGFVIVAKTEADARAIAADDCGPEGRLAWLNSEFSRCTKVNKKIQGIVLRSELMA
jgi:hypothetical protein